MKNWVWIVALLAAPAFGQRGPAYRALRAADGHADLSGSWEALGTADFDLQDHPSYAARASASAMAFPIRL